MSEKINNFVSQVMDGALVNARESFNELIGERIQGALDAKRVEIAANIYNEGVEVELEENYEFSDEEIEEILVAEGVESLDELSKQKLGQYIKRAHKDKDTQVKRANIWHEKGFNADKDKDMYDAWTKGDKAAKKANNRSKGISKAVDKLTK